MFFLSTVVQPVIFLGSLLAQHGDCCKFSHVQVKRTICLVEDGTTCVAAERL